MKITVDRAIQILDPKHRERYESLEEVNEACRMGMKALRRLRDRDFVAVVRCRDCRYALEFDEDEPEYGKKIMCLYSVEDGYVETRKKNDFCNYGKRGKANG